MAHAAFLDTQLASFFIFYINPSHCSPTTSETITTTTTLLLFFLFFFYLLLLLLLSYFFHLLTRSKQTKQISHCIAYKILQLKPTAMHAPRRFKKAFTEQLLASLQVAGLTSKSMGLRERRDAVKLASDVAMASARGRAAPWARALVQRHAAERRNEALMRRIMGSAGYERAAAAASRRKEVRSRMIVRRSHGVCSSRRKRRSLHLAAASGGGGSSNGGAGGGGAMVARRMVKGRLQLLRKLVPGGEALHGFSLLSEAMDYVVCLKTQVELMQCLCKGSQQLG